MKKQDWNHSEEVAHNPTEKDDILCLFLRGCTQSPVTCSNLTWKTTFFLPHLFSPLLAERRRSASVLAANLYLAAGPPASLSVDRNGRSAAGATPLLAERRRRGRAANLWPNAGGQWGIWSRSKCTGFLCCFCQRRKRRNCFNDARLSVAKWPSHCREGKEATEHI